MLKLIEWMWTAARASTRHWAVLQIGVTLALLGWACSRLNGAALPFHSGGVGWIALAVLCTVPPLLAVALRWSLVARRLGVDLPLGHAVPEVYVASLLNSVLPTGMAGDAARVVRHGAALAADDPQKPTRGYARALQVAVLDRLSSQAALWAVVAAGIACWPEVGKRVLWVVAAVAALLGVALWVAHAVLPGFGGRASRFGRAAYVALVAGGAWRAQLLASAIVLAGCFAIFACSACALGIPPSASTLMRVVPPLLVSRSLPISVGGFGVREATGAATFAAMGLDPGTGVAVAMLYGVCTLIGSLPGVVCLWLRRRGGAP